MSDCRNIRISHYQCGTLLRNPCWCPKWLWGWGWRGWSWWLFRRCRRCCWGRGCRILSVDWLWPWGLRRWRIVKKLSIRVSSRSLSVFGYHLGKFRLVLGYRYASGRYLLVWPSIRPRSNAHSACLERHAPSHRRAELMYLCSHVAGSESLF